MRPTFAKYVSPPKLQRIDVQRPRNDVGLRLVRPDHLRDTEPTQRSSRRLVGVDRVAIDRDIFDVVRARGRKAGLLGDTRTDVRVRPAVPPRFHFARYDAAVFFYSRLETDRRSVLGDGIELFFHRQSNANRFSN